MASDHIPTQLLDELSSGLDRLEVDVRKAAGAAFQRGSRVVAPLLVDAGSDVVAIGRELVSRQLAASQAILEWVEAMTAVSPNASEWVIISDDDWPALGELKVSWKSWFFFVRAFCDHVYALLLADAERRPRSGGSMAAALRSETNPVAVALATGAPSFLPWFAKQRDRRNIVKSGVALTCTALHSPGVAIVFDEYRFNPETKRLARHTGSGEHRVTLGDVVDDVQQLIQVVQVVAGRR